MQKCSSKAEFQPENRKHKMEIFPVELFALLTEQPFFFFPLLAGSVVLFCHYRFLCGGDTSANVVKILQSSKTRRKRFVMSLKRVKEIKSRWNNVRRTQFYVLRTIIKMYIFSFSSTKLSSLTSRRSLPVFIPLHCTHTFKSHKASCIKFMMEPKLMCGMERKDVQQKSSSSSSRSLDCSVTEHKSEDKNIFLVDNYKGEEGNCNNQKATKTVYMWCGEKPNDDIAKAEERKRLKEMLLSIRNGSQTMHFHNHYAFHFMSAVRTKIPFLFSVRLAISNKKLEKKLK